MNQANNKSTSSIKFANQVKEIIINLPGVKSVLLGRFKIGKGTTGGSHAVKIGISSGEIPSVWLLVRQGNSVAEFHVSATNTQEVMVAIARALRNNNIPISFI